MRFAKGELLFVQGECHRGVTLIQSGVVRIFYVSPELAGAAMQLLQPTELVTVASILSDHASVPDLPGIYGWWFKDSLSDVPLEGTHDDYRLLSTQGKAGTKERDAARLSRHCQPFDAWS